MPEEIKLLKVPSVMFYCAEHFYHAEVIYKVTVYTSSVIVVYAPRIRVSPFVWIQEFREKKVPSLISNSANYRRKTEFLIPLFQTWNIAQTRTVM
jgi:hypothetical protein